MPSILGGRATAENVARKSVAVGKKPYKPTTQQKKFAAEMPAQIDALFKSEERVPITLKGISLEDLKVLEEALVSARASWQVSKYGRLDGGKSKKYGVNVASVTNARIDMLLAKVRKLGKQVDKHFSA